jgi:hypothetical protein
MMVNKMYLFMNLEKILIASKSLATAIGGENTEAKVVFDNIKNAALQVRDASADIAQALNKKDFEKLQLSTEKIIDVLGNKTVKQQDFKNLIAAVGKVALCILKIVADAMSGNIIGVITDVTALLPALKEAYVEVVTATEKFTNFCKDVIIPALKDFGVQINEKILKPFQEKVVDPIKAFFAEKHNGDITKIEVGDIQKMHALIDMKIMEILEKAEQESIDAQNMDFKSIEPIDLMECFEDMDIEKSINEDEYMDIGSYELVECVDQYIVE